MDRGSGFSCIAHVQDRDVDQPRRSIGCAVERDERDETTSDKDLDECFSVGLVDPYGLGVTRTGVGGTTAVLENVKILT